MEIEFRTQTLRKICTIAAEARKKLSQEMAAKIQQRMNEIRSADSVEMMVQFGIGNCHPLHGDRKGQYALDLVQPFRLVIVKESEVVVQVFEIENYH